MLQLSSLIKICTADAIARQTDNQFSAEVPNEVMQCMNEHNEVPRYHIYKANNADFYVQARLENTSDEVSVLYPGIMKVIRTDEDSLQVPEKTRELFVNLSASDCVNKMRTDRDYIMFLKKTDQMLAEYDVILDKETKSPVWVSMAEPIKYKRKKMREITKYLDESKYCKGCPGKFFSNSFFSKAIELLVATNFLTLFCWSVLLRLRPRIFIRN